ncbi:hypothetical protein BJ138DRAFT_1119299 [Hygrophoropsis aurantiaca]|uniref:Uncharacterized protein n=1 Tax=Hygrophoropsis aurantiaca TaxID=72124 RepID=A0ACB7ZU43_9AGAM|nr:hypothetical protein BJ138DRAFT_1119299 [Hygrophoropsis aurantiaca]
MDPFNCPPSLWTQYTDLSAFDLDPSLGNEDIGEPLNHCAPNQPNQYQPFHFPPTQSAPMPLGPSTADPFYFWPTQSIPPAEKPSEDTNRSQIQGETKIWGVPSSLAEDTDWPESANHVVAPPAQILAGGSRLQTDIQDHTTSQAQSTLEEYLLQISEPQCLPESTHPMRQIALDDAAEHTQLFITTQNAFPDSETLRDKVHAILSALPSLYEPQIPQVRSVLDWTWLDEEDAFQKTFKVAKTFRNSIKSKAVAILYEEFKTVGPDGMHYFFSCISRKGLKSLERSLIHEWDSRTYFWSPIIKLVLRVWFGDQKSLGHRFPLAFSPDGVALSNEVLAFAITAIELAVVAILRKKLRSGVIQDPGDSDLSFIKNSRDCSNVCAGAYVRHLTALSDPRRASKTHQSRVAMFRVGCSNYITKGHPVLM